MQEDGVIPDDITSSGSGSMVEVMAGIAIALIVVMAMVLVAVTLFEGVEELLHKLI